MSGVHYENRKTVDKQQASWDVQCIAIMLVGRVDLTEWIVAMASAYEVSTRQAGQQQRGKWDAGGY